MTASEQVVTLGRADAADARAPEGPPAPAARCRLTVTETEGCGPGDVEALLEPVRPRIERCHAVTAGGGAAGGGGGGGGGKIMIRIHRAADGKLSFELEPGTSLDPTEKACVLEALTALSADESSTAWAGLNVRPTGFTSLITIEW
jgi:hypothetical protein